MDSANKQSYYAKLTYFLGQKYILKISQRRLFCEVWPDSRSYSLLHLQNTYSPQQTLTMKHLYSVDIGCIYSLSVDT